jgi:hypothetical protein
MARELPYSLIKRIKRVYSRGVIKRRSSHRIKRNKHAQPGSKGSIHIEQLVGFAHRQFAKCWLLP